MKGLLPLSLALLSVLAGCASFERTRGVDNTWRDPGTPAPVIGKTTQSDILKALGPPSQVIGLGEQTVFYYLKEQGRGKGALFIVYNWVNEDVIYDRAIFFFGQDGILRDYGLSQQSIAP